MTTTLQRPTLSPLPRGVSETFSDDCAVKVPSARPTPLIGSWADESWPLNSRQASEIVIQQELQRQRSSLLFEDDEGNELNAFGSEAADEEAPVDVDDLHTADGLCSELNENLSVAQPSCEDINGSAPESPSYVVRVYTWDPYNLQDAFNVVYCDPSAAAQVSTRSFNERPSEAFAAQVEEEPVAAPAPAAPKAVGASPLSRPSPTDYTVAANNNSDWDAPRQSSSNSSSGFATHMSQPQPSFHQPAQQRRGAFNCPAEHMPGAAIARSNGEQVAPPTQVTAFMPPAPPPRICTLVLEEEGAPNPSGAYYHMIMRWYNRILTAQDYFVAPDDRCPAPSKEKYSFDEWCDECSGWWYSHFEHMQKKQSRYPAMRGR